MTVGVRGGRKGAFLGVPDNKAGRLSWDTCGPNATVFLISVSRRMVFFSAFRPCNDS